MHTPNPEKQGQIAIIALLVMVVMITIGLSLYSRTTLDVSLSRQEEQGSQTFQAAESGVERALNQDFTNLTAPNGNFTVGNSTVNYSITQANSIQTLVEEGEALQVSTVGAASGNKLNITWGQGMSCPGSNVPSNTSAPPLLIRVYNVNGSAYTARNYGISPCNYNAPDFPIGSTDSSVFSPVIALPDLDGYVTNLTLQTNDRLVSIAPMYNSSTIKAVGNGWALPTQYFEINSTATSRQGSDASGETKALKVTRTLPQYPYMLDYALYSGTTILKSTN